MRHFQASQKLLYKKNLEGKIFKLATQKGKK
jgi:hypothetical protein